MSKESKHLKIKSLKHLAYVTPKYSKNKENNYSPALDKLATNSDKFCFNCQKMNYSLQADSSTNNRLNYRCKFCNKII